MSIHRRQKIEKIYENLSKLNTEMEFIQKASSEADFYQVWLDFGVPKRLQNHQKLQKKQAENIVKKKMAKKHKKSRKKALIRLTWRIDQADGEDYGGEKKPSKRAKINAKHEDRN